MRLSRSLLLTGVVAAALAAACTSVDVPESLPGPTTSTTEAAQPPTQPDCGDPTASLRPTGASTSNVPAGSYMAEIQARGQLRVGVDVSTMLFSNVDPLTGEFQGFDDDIAREVARALFGTDDPSSIVFVGIPNTDRIPALQEGRVDLVAHAFTITCARRQDIAFSSEYFHANQDVLVREDSAADSLEDLAEGTICATRGSTSADNITEALPTAELITAPERAECLVRLQQGEVDAMTSDNAILAGMAAQDPSLQLLELGESLSDEPYGLGLPPNRPEWVQYVNGVLEDVRSDGTWQRLYDRRFVQDDHLPPATPPPAVYQD